MRSSASARPGTAARAGRAEASSNDVTRFLNGTGHARAGVATVMPFVYDELKRIARSSLRKRLAAGGLEPTELVHEAYVKLFKPERSRWNDRKHFFALAARAMRQLLVDRARRQACRKRGGEHRPALLHDGHGVSAGIEFDLLDLDLALQELTVLDGRQAQVVELLYFGGYGFQEVADSLSLSKSTVERDWRAARAWLGQRLEASRGP